MFVVIMLSMICGFLVAGIVFRASDRLLDPEERDELYYEDKLPMKSNELITAYATVQKLQQTISELESKINEMRKAVHDYLIAEKQDLCHENRVQLAKAFGLKNMKTSIDGFVDFCNGCDQYQREIYGDCRTDQLHKKMQEMKENHAGKAE